MTFDLPALLAERAGQGYELQDQYLKPHLSRMLHVIGFDKVYEKGEGGYVFSRVRRGVTTLKEINKVTFIEASR